MRTPNVSRAIKLCGTEQPDVVGQILTAGPLTAELDNGNLRYLKVAGVEVLRALSYLVRDENWGTYIPALSGLKIEQRADSFSVSYSATCKRGDMEIAYQARIEGKPDGSLEFTGTATPKTDFLTARTGFVVLHPLKGVAGQPVEIEHVDGKVEKSKFPPLVDPVQPFLLIRSLTHEVLPGLKATVRMDGDAWEMEDHRNWSDASFKTYVRPLALPWPYTLKAGEPVKQSVTLRLTGAAPKSAQSAKTQGRRGEGRGRDPPEHACGRTGHAGRGDRSRHSTARSAQACRAEVADLPVRRASAARPERAVRLPRCVRADRRRLRAGGRSRERGQVQAGADGGGGAGARGRAESLGRRRCARSATSSPCCPAVRARRHRRSRSSTIAAREAFPGVKLGGGMFSFFTELNRKRPPAALLDFVHNSTCPIVHAADDRSVMETLEALPYQVATARSYIGKTPYRIGPSTIGCRDNPHGKTFTPNPDNERICLVRMDPRQRGLFGAAWTLGYIASFAPTGVEAVSIGAPTGPLGIIPRKADYRQPYYDQLSGTVVYPAFHVVAGLTRAAGLKLVSATSSDDATVRCLAYKAKGATLLWLANLTAQDQTVTLAHEGGAMFAATLDETSFEKATTDPIAFEASCKPLAAPKLTLKAYAVGIVCINDK